MIKKIISGGQTGADQGGLIAAKKLGISTGGIAPLGFRTEKGSNLKLKQIYGLQEHHSYNYPPRTKLNIANSDGTIIFYNTISGGTKLTLELCQKFGKSRFMVPFDKDINFVNLDLDFGLYLVCRSWINTRNIQVLNVAGSRESKAPGIQEFTTKFLVKLLQNAKC